MKFVNGDEVYEAGVTTPQESATIDVRDCGAKGDGKHDDTVSIQAAIMACPKDGRVLVPAGKYLVKSLFLKSGCSIELQEGAQILARHDRDQLAYIPGTLKGTEGLGKDATDLFPLGRWEGESISSYCSLFTGLSVHNVQIYGRGTIDGQTDFADDNWWHNVKDLYRPEEGRDIARPRMVFLSECSHVSLAGITVQNSPAWNIHPVLCDHFDALCLKICGPKNSHNTDGCDPESCSFVRILGCEFSVGDDCIAIKSGKLGIDRPLRPATHDMLVAHCLMHDGHGAVVLGSEAAGGIKDLVVRDCDFRRTDRGLRVKTRRGRGNDAVNEGILFENIHMDHVLTPFVVNAFYFCDKDGKTDYAQSTFCSVAKPCDSMRSFQQARVRGSAFTLMARLSPALSSFCSAVSSQRKQTSWVRRTPPGLSTRAYSARALSLLSPVSIVSMASLITMSKKASSKGSSKALA